MSGDPFSQEEYRVRLEWGRDGARRAATRGDILVIVDVLRFSTAVITAVQRGASIAPCAKEDDPYKLAEDFGAEVATHQRGVSHLSHYSLSPRSYARAKPGNRIILPSPNGATCSRLGAQVPFLFAGAFVNARAIASTIGKILEGTELAVTVVACGERWTEAGEDGTLRFALEDYLGAGSILRHLGGNLSPEAEVCASAYRDTQTELLSHLLHCGSGRELVERGDKDDVHLAASVNLFSTVPVLRDGWFVPWTDDFRLSP